MKFFLVFLFFFIFDALGCQSPKDCETTPEVIEQNGYKCETHKTYTEDDYEITIHRIRPHDKCTGGRVCLLMHGIFQSSYHWVLTGRGYSLAFFLADLCCDVWLGNLRENGYSKGHKYLKEEDTKYWEFSQDEHGKYDVPATIRYILNHTNLKKLDYFGYDLGSMVLFIAAIEDSEINSMINSHHALAPTAYLFNSPSLLYRVASLFEPLGTIFTILFGNFEFCPANKYTVGIVSFFCSYFPKVCKLGPMACGNTFTEYDAEAISKAEKCSSPVSTKVVLHMGQYYLNFYFAKYRTSIIPPEEYNLSKVTHPTYIYHSSCDKCADPEDVSLLISGLGDAVKNVTLFEGVDHYCFMFCDKKTVEINEKVIYNFRNEDRRNSIE